MGAGTSHAEPEVFCVLIQRTIRQLPNDRFSPNLVTKRIRCPIMESGKTFSKNFNLVVICPKIWNRKSVKQAPHSEQATGHVMHCREILFTPRCNPRAREFPRSGQLFYTTYRASKSHGLHRRMIPMSPCGSRRSKGCLPWPEISCDFW